MGLKSNVDTKILLIRCENAGEPERPLSPISVSWIYGIWLGCPVWN
jgi:hypothetical protein